MGTKLWEVKIGKGIDSLTIKAETIEEAIGKAKLEYAKQIKEAPEEYAITSAELREEADIE